MCDNHQAAGDSAWNATALEIQLHLLLTSSNIVIVWLVAQVKQHNLLLAKRHKQMSRTDMTGRISNSDASKPMYWRAPCSLCADFTEVRLPMSTSVILLVGDISQTWNKRCNRSLLFITKSWPVNTIIASAVI